MLRISSRAVVIVAGLLVSPTISNAQVKDCVQGRAIVEMGYDDAPVSIQVRSGKVCRRHLDFPQFEMKSFEIVERPRHGSITDLGRGRWEYKAKAGYEGSDSFKLRWSGQRIDWRTGANQGATLIGARYSVSVVR
jgi:hypothetical protein